MTSDAGDTATRAAFDRYRKRYGPAREPLFVRHPSDCDQIECCDGLIAFTDGPGARAVAPARLPLFAIGALPVPARVWAVRETDVVHAAKVCAFGAARAAGEVKHTNLTGGRPAFCGGEILAVSEDTLIISGDSGRYGPRDAGEMLSVATAFKDSGYTVYSMGFDEGVNQPFKFIGPEPQRI